MINTSEIVKNYIEGVIKGKGLGLEEYVKEILKGKTKAELKQYCNENNIFCKIRDDNRSDFLDRIYGSCNTQMTYLILGSKSVDGESETEFYERIYKNNFVGVDLTKKEDIKIKKEPEGYLEYIKNSNNKYPENIMKILRQEEGLNKYDFSRDEELNKTKPNEAFKKVMIWEDMYEDEEYIKGWVKNIYGVDLDSIE